MTAMQSAINAAHDRRWSDAWVCFWCAVGMAACDMLLVSGPMLFLLLLLWLGSLLP